MYLKKIKIGNVELDNNLILAPMAGVTNLPFRIICEKFEPGMVCTEMASSKAIFYNDQKQEDYLIQKERRDLLVFRYLEVMRKQWAILQNI